MTTTNHRTPENMTEETKHGTTESKAVDQQQACSALVRRLQVHRAHMAPHQKTREQGKLVLDSLAMIEVMRDVLRCSCFYTAGRKEFDRQGYSLLVEEETGIRDINYRDAPLHSSPDDAIDAAIAEYWPNSNYPEQLSR